MSEKNARQIKWLREKLSETGEHRKQQLQDYERRLARNIASTLRVEYPEVFCTLTNTLIAKQKSFIHNSHIRMGTIAEMVGMEKELMPSIEVYIDQQDALLGQALHNLSSQRLTRVLEDDYEEN